MKKEILILLFVGCFLFLQGQENQKEIAGVVSYITSQNVYVKFPSAKKIKEGDQVFVKQNEKLIPVMVVEHLSSVSCVGKPIGESSLKIGDVVYALVPEDNEPEKIEKAEIEKPVQDASIHADEAKDSKEKPEQKIQGRLMVSSYSNISNLSSSDNYRFRYTFSLNAANIANSRLSFDNYISFTHTNDNWADIKADVFSGLKIYSLNLAYKLSENTALSVGRKINPKVSSIGAIDGVQFESGFKNLYFGAMAGFRPDYNNYGFNFNLLEYGAYVGHTVRTSKGRMQTSLAMFQQTNSGNIDRRFAYVQHDNTLLKNFSFFVSSELDLYRLQDGQPLSDLILTSLYASVRYRPFSKFSILCSYDNRRNVIYYETFKNYIDLLLQDATRQGLQVRLNYKPIKNMYAGLSGSYRVRDNDARPTENANAFLTYSDLPWIHTSVTLTANALQNSYLSGMVYGARFTRDFISGKMNAGLNYRYVDYAFANNDSNLKQHIGELDLSYRFSRKFSLSLNYEGTFENQTNYHRVYFSAIKRF